MSYPAPDQATWTFETGGQYGGDDHEVKVSYANHRVTIEVGTDAVTLVADTMQATHIGAAIAAALRLGSDE